MHPLADPWFRFWHFLLYWTGVSQESGRGYGFWSGFGSCLMYFTAITVWWRKHTCHVDHCFRFGHHDVTGTPYTVCRKHHPDVPSRVTHSHILSLHKKD